MNTESEYGSSPASDISAVTALNPSSAFFFEKMRLSAPPSGLCSEIPDMSQRQSRSAPSSFAATVKSKQSGV